MYHRSLEHFYFEARNGHDLRVKQELDNTCDESAPFCSCIYFFFAFFLKKSQVKNVHIKRHKVTRLRWKMGLRRAVMVEGPVYPTSATTGAAVSFSTPHVELLNFDPPDRAGVI